MIGRLISDWQTSFRSFSKIRFRSFDERWDTIWNIFFDVKRTFRQKVDGRVLFVLTVFVLSFVIQGNWFSWFLIFHQKRSKSSSNRVDPHGVCVYKTDLLHEDKLRTRIRMEVEEKDPEGFFFYIGLRKSSKVVKTENSWSDHFFLCTKNEIPQSNTVGRVIEILSRHFTLEDEIGFRRPFDDFGSRVSSPDRTRADGRADERIYVQSKWNQL